ncbi:hypothetical protein HBA55_21915 [Pseudomaricurvus alkylphenolicus]|uniref:hypothetical protein n=1 Tax=Pseudomaricurvus alkylphenolicus TaxID=1306991 RepID=UPI0014226516|nr:hypothetical protein [Pseudomaricurvus alkylphenolicus]NIB42279.1 hypothetical protein [Pseudomaricurvus alkylphenolicus]
MTRSQVAELLSFVSARYRGSQHGIASKASPHDDPGPECTLLVFVDDDTIRSSVT